MSPRVPGGIAGGARQECCWLSSPGSGRGATSVRAGAGAQLLPPTPSSQPGRSEPRARHGKMDEASTASSLRYFGAIHHPDPCQAALGGSLRSDPCFVLTKASNLHWNYH